MRHVRRRAAGIRPRRAPPGVAAGLGAIARVVSEGQEIYARKLIFSEARGRIEGAHRPYHAALERLIAEAHRTHGFAILIDWHSMPAAAAKAGGRDRPADFVLGDRFGAACAGVLRRVERELEAMGYRVARNTPYAGGYTTEHYGRPHEGWRRCRWRSIGRSTSINPAFRRRRASPRCGAIWSD